MAATAKGLPAIARAAIDRLQRDGGKLVGRVERDLEEFTRRTRAELTKEAKMLRREFTSFARDANRKLDGRPSEMLAAVEKRLLALEGEVRRRLDIARTGEVTALQARLAGLERRLGDTEQRLAELADQFRDRVGAGPG